MSDIVDAITLSDQFDCAYRTHLAGIGVRLHPRVPFERCTAHPCTLFWAALRAGEIA